MSCCDNTDNLLAIKDALEQMLAQVTPTTKTSLVSLPSALGFVLAEDILSPMNVPPFANSAMDGYAINLSDLEHTNILPVAGKSFAGQPFTEQLPNGYCLRIMTGAPIPDRCNAVVMQENTKITDQGIEFLQTNIKEYNNIRPLGNDIAINDLVLAKGSRLTPRDIPMLASLGIEKISVYAKPKVAFFSTGDEIKALGEPLVTGQIYDSNSYSIKILLEKFGCEPIDLGIIPDNPSKLKEAFNKAAQLADLVITSGGVSVGEADHTKDILKQLGTINFWKLAIKPGKPFAFGSLQSATNSTWFCGLPGNPVSAMITMYVLVQPLIAKLTGNLLWQEPQLLSATAQTPFKKAIGRIDYQRGIYSVQNGKIVVSSIANQSSGAFRSMSLANCLIVLERQRGNVEIGEHVSIQLFNETLY